MSKRKILLSLKSLLAPIARFCVRHGLRVQDVEETFKLALVEAAATALQSEGQPTNASRLSATTGIPRKFIPKYRVDSDLGAADYDIMSRVIGQWQNDTKFLDKRGKPRALEVSGASSEFSELVRLVSADLNSYTVLKELLRLEHVEKHGDKIKLRTQFHRIEKLSDAMSLVAEDSSALYRAAEENTLSKSPQNLHLSTRFDNIPHSAIPKIREWMLREGSEFHARARSMLSGFDRDFQTSKRMRPDDRYQVHLGAFSFVEKFKTDNLKKSSERK